PPRCMRYFSRLDERAKSLERVLRAQPRDAGQYELRLTNSVKLGRRQFPSGDGRLADWLLTFIGGMADIEDRSKRLILIHKRHRQTRQDPLVHGMRKRTYD